MKERPPPADTPWDQFFPALPPDARHAVLTRAAAGPTDLPPLPALSGLTERFLAADPDRLPPFAPALPSEARRAPAEHHALSAALGCPDLFLAGADPGPAQLAFASDLCAEAARAGERVLVLSPSPADADAVVARLADVAGLLAGRALAPGEHPDRLPAVVAVRTARAHGDDALAAVRQRVTAGLADAEAKLAAVRAAAEAVGPMRAAADRLAGVADAEDRLRRDRDDVRAKAAASADPALAAELARADADAQKAAADLAARRAERDDLRHHLDAARAPKKSGVVALFKSLLHRDAPANVADIEAKAAAADDAVRALEAEAGRLAAELARLAEAVRADRDRRTADEADRASQSLDEALAALAAERADAEATVRRGAEALAAAGVAADDVPAALTQADEAVRCVRGWAVDLANRGPEVARQFLAQVRVVACTPAALDRDPLAALTRDGRPAFDRVVWTEADRFLDPEWPALPVANWVLIGDPSGPPTRGGPRNGRPAPRPTSFRQLWRHLHRTTWATEDGRLVAVLAEAAGPMAREPLADRPEVELRFLTARGGDRLLAEVAFPRGWSLADAKAFLAGELGEVRLAPCGPVVWHADGLTACWPAADADDAAWVALAPGVREKLVGRGPDHRTAAVEFDPAAGWTPAAAAEWLAATLGPCPRTAALPRPAATPEPTKPRLAAGVAG